MNTNTDEILRLREENARLTEAVRSLQDEPGAICDHRWYSVNGETVSPCRLPKGHFGNHEGFCLGSKCSWPQGYHCEEHYLKDSKCTAVYWKVVPKDLNDIPDGMTYEIVRLYFNGKFIINRTGESRSEMDSSKFHWIHPIVLKEEELGRDPNDL